MVTKSTILGLIAALTVILIVVSMTGDDSTKYVTMIGIEFESGFSESCVESKGGTGCYTPSVAYVKQGSVVTMTNTDPTNVHTFTSGTVDEFTPSPDGIFNSGALMSGEALNHKFSQYGTYDYYCKIHTWMIGKIIVS